VTEGSGRKTDGVGGGQVLKRQKDPPVRGHLHPRQPRRASTPSQQVRAWGRGGSLVRGAGSWRRLLCAHGGGSAGECGAGPCWRHRPWPGQQSAGPPPPNGRRKTLCKAESGRTAMRGPPGGQARARGAAWRAQVRP
jgi:hypothetical protein